MNVRLLFVLALGLGALTASSPPPLQPVAGAPVDGVRCEPLEGQAVHLHAHLTVLIAGKPYPVPSDVGRPATAGCIYWIHTHAGDGVIHVESPQAGHFTLGQFFALWGQPLDARNVAGVTLNGSNRVQVYLGGKAWRRDPAAIVLTQHADIVLEVGPPFTEPTPFAAWNGL
ncbi:hypothetical protein EPN52_14370 [bacterium]|nr:MAG: hypothetical protein EPN52_14370 [bacterium]